MIDIIVEHRFAEGKLSMIDLRPMSCFPVAGQTIDIKESAMSSDMLEHDFVKWVHGRYVITHVHVGYNSRNRRYYALLHIQGDMNLTTR